jgi:hypothetical protein
MAIYACAACMRLTEHVSIVLAARLSRRNRKTIKNWVEKEWVAFKRFPSGRTYICTECLMKSGGPSAPKVRESSRAVSPLRGVGSSS